MHQWYKHLIMDGKFIGALPIYSTSLPPESGFIQTPDPIPM